MSQYGDSITKRSGGRSIAPKQQRAVTVAAVDRDCRARVLDLAAAAAAPQLRAGFVGVAEAVKTPCGELAAAGVQRQRAVDRSPCPAGNEARRLAAPAQPHRFEPQPDVDREAVVDLGTVDVLRRHVGA